MHCMDGVLVLILHPTTSPLKVVVVVVVDENSENQVYCDVIME